VLAAVQLARNAAAASATVGTAIGTVAAMTGLLM
jgi:hypothetical protein